MASYKCISCGNIKESEVACSCSECGYRMFPVPYDRKVVLTEEIQKFIQSLFVKDIKDGQLSYFRKELNKKTENNENEDEYEIILKITDDKRFPDFSKIQKYVCSADKTEKFIERLNSSLDNIEKYISTPYQMEYEVDFRGLENFVLGSDERLQKALAVFNVDSEIRKPAFSATKLDYSEIPDNDLLILAKSLVKSLRELVTKIFKFVKINNIYGTAYSKEIKCEFESNENTDFCTVFSKTRDRVEKTIEKKYQVDIFSDGTDELHKMLKVLWNGINVIMQAPILTKTFRFSYNGESCFKTEFYEKLICDIAYRYSFINDTVLSATYFADKNETELFDLYIKMIELDYKGIFGVNKSKISVPGKHEEQLNKLIGLSGIKESIKKIKAYAINNKGKEALNLHMCFYGNPGTGKTEVARIIAGILHENKILPTDKVVEVDRGDLIGQYVGETPQKTMSKIEEAMGGVLFIDEAYSLVPKDLGFDYGHEAVATLIKAMEDKRGKFCVILAGYKNQMLDMIASNPGFKSRIQFELDFPNYSKEELQDITSLMLRKREYKVTDVAMQKILDITDVKRREPNFANAREIRNILDGVIMCQNLRALGTDDNELGIVDVNKYIEDSKINLPIGVSSKKIMTAEEELDELIGLDSVKRMVRKIKAFAKKNKNTPDFNLHMCFYGNPGTGKTEVARILSSILYDAGVLAEAKLVETDSHGLIGQYVGETAPKTQAKISDAMGGVLFIDEAYGLANTGESSKNYGSEAIEVLLKNMEDNRGKFCVILAGYKNEIKTMISMNPGLASRIQFNLDFPDYTREELGQIAKKFLAKKSYVINESALDLLLNVVEYYRNFDNFANARTVRNILDQVIMNQNLRTEDDESDDRNIIRCDVEDYIADEDIDINNTPIDNKRIGFV